MKIWLVPYFSSLLLMLMLDGAWIALMARRFYGARLGALMADPPHWGPAALFYLIYACALVLFVVTPLAREQAGVMKIFLLGALFGLAAYGTYDLTNQAMLRGWPLAVTVVDMAWGTLLTGVVATAAVQISRRFI